MCVCVCVRECAVAWLRLRACALPGQCVCVLECECVCSACWLACFFVCLIARWLARFLSFFLHPFCVLCLVYRVRARVPSPRLARVLEQPGDGRAVILRQRLSKTCDRWALKKGTPNHPTLASRTRQSQKGSLAHSISHEQQENGRLHGL